MSFTKWDLMTLKRALAFAMVATHKRVRAAQATVKAGKKPKQRPSELAMTYAEYATLFKQVETMIADREVAEKYEDAETTK